MSRLDFLKQAAPENYVAGLGRGATGFTTRSDLGPARDGPSGEQIQDALAKRAKQLGIEAPTAYGQTTRKGQGKDAEQKAKEQAEKEGEEQDDGRYDDPDNETGLFAHGMYDREDDEADRIYQDVDEKMERRRKQRREDREQREQEEYDKANPKISAQFSDLKRDLATLTADDWANLPDPGDLTGKNKRVKKDAKQRFYAVPDSVLAGARDSTQFETSVQEDGNATTNGNTKDGTITNFADIGAARNKVLQVRMDQAAQGQSAETNGTSTTIDPKGYLTSLAGAEMKAGEIEIGDINRVRALLDSVIKTNPKHAPAWIARARLEELAGKIVAARKFVAQGCEQAPRSEDAWLENIRLNDNHNAKIIAANAIKHNNKSTRLWIEAMQLESDPRAKKRVLKQAIDHIPTSVAIWKEAVNLEEDVADARLMLAKATEIIPLSIDLWLALARIETPENAQAVLNKARKANPTSHEIWIAAAHLQEQLGQATKINVINRAVKALAKENAMPSREDWLVLAEKSEEQNFPITAQSIIREVLGYSLDEDDDRRQIFLEDAKNAINHNKPITARAIYAYALRIFPNKPSLWLAATDLERSNGTPSDLTALLEKAVEACPQASNLWLLLAKEKQTHDSLDDARLVLARAFKQNPNNESIWLAAVRLESSTDNSDAALQLLSTARQEAPTERVWYKSVAYLRQLDRLEEALDLVLQGLQDRFPRCAKLWMQKGQIYQSLKQAQQAREAYSSGTRNCPKSIPLWLLSAQLEESQSNTVRARSILDRARLQNPKNPTLWLESIRLERRVALQKAKQTAHPQSKNGIQAGVVQTEPDLSLPKSLMSRAKQECPHSPALWSYDIWNLQPRTQRKPLSLEAIKQTDTSSTTGSTTTNTTASSTTSWSPHGPGPDPSLFSTVARIFQSERRLEKASSWFEKAILLNPQHGDTWAWYWRFLLEYGTEEKREEVLKRCAAVEPKYGEVWAGIRKDPGHAGWSVELVLGHVAKVVGDE